MQQKGGRGEEWFAAISPSILWDLQNLKPGSDYSFCRLQRKTYWASPHFSIQSKLQSVWQEPVSLLPLSQPPPVTSPAVATITILQLFSCTSVFLLLHFSHCSTNPKSPTFKSKASPWHENYLDLGCQTWHAVSETLYLTKILFCSVSRAKRPWS